MANYKILVRYRTKSGCNAKDVEVEAKSMSHALELACDKVRRMRGVVWVDGGYWREPNYRLEPLSYPDS